MDSIKKLVISQLREHFSHCKVYDEPVQQDLSLPCFILNANKATHERLTGDLMHTHIFIFLTYYPSDSDDKRAEMEGVMTNFYSGAWRYLGNKHHIHNLDLEHNDEVLTISFSLDVYHAPDKDRGPVMDTLGGSVAIKQPGNGPKAHSIERRVIAK